MSSVGNDPDGSSFVLEREDAISDVRQMRVRHQSESDASGGEDKQ